MFIFLHVLNHSMASALPTLAMKRHPSHDIHHQMPSIITPGKSSNMNASKASNIQVRGRMPSNHQRLANNFVLPPLESESSQKQLSQENINISNSFQSGLNMQKSMSNKIEKSISKDDGYIDSRYSDNGDEISDDSDKVDDDDDEGGEVFDADPAEFGITITKL